MIGLVINMLCLFYLPPQYGSPVNSTSLLKKDYTFLLSLFLT